MDWVHCNKCYKRPKEMRVYVTSCGHLACKACLANEPDSKCAVCQKPCQAEEICNKMRPDMMDLFREPREYAGMLLKQLHATVIFQSQHRSHALKIRTNKTTQLVEMRNKTMKEIETDFSEINLAKQKFLGAREDLKIARSKKKELLDRLAALKKERSILEAQLKDTMNPRVKRSHTEPPAKKKPSSTKSAADSQFKPLTLTQAPDLESLFSDDEADMSVQLVTSTPTSNVEASRKEYMRRMFTAGQKHPSPIITLGTNSEYL